MKEFDVVIIGAGPAGLTAAIYGQRSSLKCCLVEKSAPGGKIVSTAFIENYPGFKSISGPELAFEMYNQATSLGATYIGAKALKIKEDNKFKLVELDNNEVLKAKAIIIAIGMENKKLKIPGEDTFYGKGVSYCAICDGMFFKNKIIAVVGSGNSACEEAIYLSTIGEKVYLIIRGDKMKADAHIINQVKESKNIEILFNTIGVSIKGEGKVEEFEVKNIVTNEIKNLKVSAVFPFIGLTVEPLDDSSLKMKKTINNFYVVNEHQETSTPGIFAAGDINDKKFRQISTAINDGTIAALSAKEYIQNNFK